MRMAKEIFRIGKFKNPPQRAQSGAIGRFVSNPVGQIGLAPSRAVMPNQDQPIYQEPVHQARNFSFAPKNFSVGDFRAI